MPGKGFVVWFRPEEGEVAEVVELREVREKPGGDPAVDPSLETCQAVGVTSQHQELQYYNNTYH